MRNQIEFKYSAPYFKVGDTTPETNSVWIIFHGYGQLVEDFKDNFTSLQHEQVVLIFPEGLNHFYLRGTTDKIGSSWMTSYERELQIANYNAYLNTLYHDEMEKVGANVSLNILGFSQGAHTASRWININSIPYTNLVLWGGSLAHEINSDHTKAAFSQGSNFTIIGDNDRFIGEREKLEMRERYDQIRFKHQLIEYSGTHAIYPEVLQKFVQDYDL